MKKGILILTSIGLSCAAVYEKINEIFTNRERKAVAIVTTAAEGKEENKYSKLAKQQFLDLGFSEVVFVDLEEEALLDIKKYCIVYVCGGNTYKLLKFAWITNFKMSVENLLTQGGLYIGVSAGSIILGPTIAQAGEVLTDINEVALESATGLNVINQAILPHYSDNIEDDATRFERKYHIPLVRIDNMQALLISGGVSSKIE